MRLQTRSETKRINSYKTRNETTRETQLITRPTTRIHTKHEYLCPTRKRTNGCEVQKPRHESTRIPLCNTNPHEYPTRIHMKTQQTDYKRNKRMTNVLQTDYQGTTNVLQTQHQTCYTRTAESQLLVVVVVGNLTNSTKSKTNAYWEAARQY